MDRPHLYPALLKYWRRRRGMSQLDLAMVADVSSRHISFLETGRSAPSENMTLRLADTLQVPLREQNQMLRASGFEAIFEQEDVDAMGDPAIEAALERMLQKQEPYPMVVMDQAYTIVRTNRAADAMLMQLIADPAALEPPLNGMELLFDPRFVRPFIQDWETVGRELFSRLYRESLDRAEDPRVRELTERLLRYPGVPKDWKFPDFSCGQAAIFSVRLERGSLSLHFMTTITRFSSPQNVTVEELRIESYFPVDDATDKACRALLQT
jgi:transcriptional regulator with XRE-family HTH domain